MADQNEDGQYVLDDMMRNCVHEVIEMAKGWEGFETCVELLEANYDRYIETMAAIYKPSWKCSYQVLNHGDYHSKNSLVRDEGRTQEDFFVVRLCAQVDVGNSFF